jgi:hypothetical protein
VSLNYRDTEGKPSPSIHPPPPSSI